MRMLLAAGVKAIKYIYDYKNDELVTHFATEMGVTVDKF